MTRILFLSGSQRRESFNTRLLIVMAAMLARQCEDLPINDVGNDKVNHRCDIDIVRRGEIKLPLFDQDLEQDPQTMQHVSFLAARILAADGLVIACPEYNGQMTPYLKNIVDWVSRLPYIDPLHIPAFAYRPVLLCSASTGLNGGAMVMPQARALFGYVGATVLGDTINIPCAGQAWSGAGDLAGYDFDPLLYQRIEQALHQLLRLAALTAADRIAAINI